MEEAVGSKMYDFFASKSRILSLTFPLLGVKEMLRTKFLILKQKNRTFCCPQPLPCNIIVNPVVWERKITFSFDPPTI